MGQAKILIVEDDRNLLAGIQAILELDGYEVLSAENGLQALEILRHEPELPHLIVSDIMMPQMDGIELLKAVREEQKWIAIPFIYLTAKGDKSDVLRGRVLGVDDYLVKPFDGEELLIAVESRLKRHEALVEVVVAVEDDIGIESAQGAPEGPGVVGIAVDARREAGVMPEGKDAGAAALLRHFRQGGTEVRPALPACLTPLLPGGLGLLLHTQGLAVGA